MTTILRRRKQIVYLAESRFFSSPFPSSSPFFSPFSFFILSPTSSSSSSSSTYYFLLIRLLDLLPAIAPRFLPNQERMFRTVDLCLRLECPALQEPLEVPPFLLGDPAARPPPPPRPWLSQSLRSVLEEHPDTAMEEAVLVENFLLIGKGGRVHVFLFIYLFFNLKMCRSNCFKIYHQCRTTSCKTQL